MNISDFICINNNCRRIFIALRYAWSNISLITKIFTRFWKICTKPSNAFLLHLVNSLFYFMFLRVIQTFTSSWWDSNTHKILECDDAGEKTAVFGPDLCDGFPSASVHDHSQSKAMQHGVKIHPLTHHVYRQQKTHLTKQINNTPGVVFQGTTEWKNTYAGTT